MRLFAGIALPSPVRDHLSQALAMSSAPQRSARSPWGPATNWHITLAFYGDQPESMVAELIANLKAAAGRTPRFEVGLAGAGVFRHEVCWIGVADPTNALGPLAEKVRAEYVTAPQNTQNRFHVTISRAGRRSGLEDKMAALSVYRGPTWLAEKITLYRSDLGAGVGGHPRYTRLAEAPLVEPA